MTRRSFASGPWLDGPRVSRRAWLVFRRNLLVFRRTWLANITFNFIEPLLYLAALGLGLGAYVQDIQGLSYIQWIAPGLIASSAMWATASECTYDSYVRMEYQKVFQALIVTPLNAEEIIVGEILFGAFKGVLYGSVILLVLLALGLVQSVWALALPLALIPAGLVFAELAMTWTGLVARIDSFNYFFTLVVTPMFLFGGVFFPLEGLPAAVRTVAWFMPLYHLSRLVRGLVLGRLGPELLASLVWLLIVALAFAPVPLLLMRRRLVR